MRGEHDTGTRGKALFGLNLGQGAGTGVVALVPSYRALGMHQARTRTIPGYSWLQSQDGSSRGIPENTASPAFKLSRIYQPGRHAAYSLPFVWKEGIIGEAGQAQRTTYFALFLPLASPAATARACKKKKRFIRADDGASTMSLSEPSKS